MEAFFSEYGLVITLIAVLGIAILGILKYCNVFKKIDEKKRHYLYILISVMFSVVATGIYLACIGKFSIDYMIGVTVVAVFGLNQTFYNIFKVTPINDLFVAILDFIKGLFVKETTETTEATEATVNTTTTTLATNAKSDADTTETTETT